LCTYDLHLVLWGCWHGVCTFKVETIDYKYAIKRKGAKYGYEQDNRN